MFFGKVKIIHAILRLTHILTSRDTGIVCHRAWLQKAQKIFTLRARRWLPYAALSRACST